MSSINIFVIASSGVLSAWLSLAYWNETPHQSANSIGSSVTNVQTTIKGNADKSQRKIDEEDHQSTPEISFLTDK